ncbi:MAG TPA: enoyl-CoA hydratase-related protein [Bacillota bacterium]
MERVSYRRSEDIGYITLQNEKQHNALSLKLLLELDELLQNIARQRDAKVFVIEGSKKVFSAGHHLKEIQTKTEAEVLNLFHVCQDLMRTIREIPQLVISKVEGVAVAAGCQLVAISDLAIASEDAKFGTPGINSGLFCSTPGVFLSRNIGRKKAVELLFTGKLMDAQEALQSGLVNRVVPSANLHKETEKFAKEITKQSLNIIEIGKKQFYEQINMHDFAALQCATEVIAKNSKHPDAVEGIEAFFAKRTPVWNEA